MNAKAYNASIKTEVTLSNKFELLNICWGLKLLLKLESNPFLNPFIRTKNRRPCTQPLKCLFNLDR